jgi:hypothetical protein
MASDWSLAEPVSGRLDTILMVGDSAFPLHDETTRLVMIKRATKQGNRFSIITPLMNLKSSKIFLVGYPQLIYIINPFSARGKKTGL